MITKIIANRIQTLMSKLVGHMHNNFILGRSITDNVVLAQEVVHLMQLKKGRKGWMMLKLDLEKAYDRLRWDFITDTILDMGLPNTFAIWIYEFVSSSTMRVLWDGEVTTQFTPSRGIRPLSLCLMP